MIQIGFKNDRGIRRTNNEDACFVIPSENIYIIADGVGGNNSGEIASRTAVAMMAEYVRDNKVPDAGSEDDVRRYFTECIYRINKEIYLRSHDSEENKGMATTIVAAYIDGDSAYIVNVGDSRAYLLRDGTMDQITEDHTYVNELFKNGIITEEEVVHHPNKNIITRAIGGDAVVEPDIFRIGIKKDDILLMCTDGLYDEVGKEDMVSIIMSSDNMTDACRELVSKANNSGGRDNITVVCLKI